MMDWEVDKNKSKRIELLAPAGSLDILRTAVHAGADAIYIGGEAYSARAGARNFTQEEMIEGIRYAHFYQKKVLIAANTLVKDKEIWAYLSYLEFLAQERPDAIIIQDLGLIDITRRYLPDLAIHASTQLTISNQYGVQKLKEMGIKRVVLARELTLDEIQSIKKAHPDIELEVFIHGAQCICYSGQCLMSSMIGGRSGNRGQCAQPCRLPYQLNFNQGEVKGNLISPKDLYGLPLIEQLVAAGVNTLKIEGRLKNKNYVYQTVSSYRAAIDEYYLAQGQDAKGKAGPIIVKNIDDYNDFINKDKRSQKIAQTFNREFSSAYLLGPLGADLISLARHNNKGSLIGKVVKYQPQLRKLSLEVNSDLVLGDGIYIDAVGGGMGFSLDKIWLKGQEVSEVREPTRIDVNINSRQLVQLKKGDLVYKSFDKELAEEIESADEAKKIGISFNLFASLGQPLTLKFTDEDGYQGQIIDEYLAQEARKHPTSSDMIRDQLGRLGDSPYYLVELSVNLDKGNDLMVPASVLNRIRRAAVEECNYLRTWREPYIFIDDNSGEKRNTQEEVQEETNEKAYKQVYKQVPNNEAISSQINILVAKIADYKLVEGLNPIYREIYFDGDWTDLSKTIRLSGERPVFACLSAMVKESQVDTVKGMLRQAIHDGVAGFVLSQVGQKEMIDSLELDWGGDHGFPSDLAFVYDYGMNVFNQTTYNLLAASGSDRIVLSVELNKREVDGLSPRGIIYLHSRYRLMISEYNLLSSHNLQEDESREKLYFLEDRKNYRMPVRENYLGQLEIYNAQVTSLLEEMGEIMAAGKRALIVDVSKDFLDINMLQDTLTIYADAYQRLGKSEQQISASPRETVMSEEVSIRSRKLEKIYKGQLTKGHYNRGVK